MFEDCSSLQSNWTLVYPIGISLVGSKSNTSWCGQKCVGMVETTKQHGGREYICSGCFGYINDAFVDSPELLTSSLQPLWRAKV